MAVAVLQETRPCRRCTTPFTPDDPHQAYCNDDCAHQAVIERRRRNREERRKIEVRHLVLTCMVCRETFERDIHVNKPVPRCCSKKKCWNDLRRLERLPQTQAITCIECGTTVEMTFLGTVVPKHCSDECRAKTYGEDYAREHPLRKPRICKRCRREFTPPAHVGRPPLFCSEDCRIKKQTVVARKRRQSTPIPCEICKKGFRWDKRVHKGRLRPLTCSPECEEERQRRLRTRACRRCRTSFETVHLDPSRCPTCNGIQAPAPPAHDLPAVLEPDDLELSPSARRLESLVLAIDGLLVEVKDAVRRGDQASVRSLRSSAHKLTVQLMLLLESQRRLQSAADRAA